MQSVNFSEKGALTVLTEKKLCILKAQGPDVPAPLADTLYQSAARSLLYEKSLRCLTQGAIGKADIILPLGGISADRTSKPVGGAVTVPIKPPVAQPLNFDHGLAAGESLHGYVTQDGTLLTLHSLPKGRQNICLKAVTGAPTHQLTKAAHHIVEHCSLKGPWYAVAGTTAEGPNITVYPYPEPESIQLFNALGLNWYALSIFEAQGKPVSVLRQKLEGSVLFTPEAIVQLQLKVGALYLDLDDTLIVHKRLNPHIVSLVKRCCTAQIPVYLITRHVREPHLTLADYALETSQFKSIIWIRNGSPKSDHITADEAIFIDDSFNERLAVHSALHIPVFPPEIAEILSFQIPARGLGSGAA